MHKRKLKWILPVVTGIILLLAIMLPTINAAWFAYIMPAGFSDAMTGTFTSDRYMAVSGRLFVKPLKHDLCCGETCEVETILYYNLWSFYRPGQIVRTRLVCTVFDNQIEGGNFFTPVRYERSSEFVSRQRNPEEPLIRYLGIPGAISVGSYRTASPNDYGHWVLDSR